MHCSSAGAARLQPGIFYGATLERGDPRSEVRRPNGHTFIGNDRSIFELDENDNVVRKINVAPGNYFRFLSMTDKGNMLFTAGVTLVKETDNSGKTIRTLDLSEISKDIKKPYSAQRMKNGHTLISTGYGATLIEVDENWKVIRQIGGKKCIPGVSLYFFAQTELLSNGNIVVANWSGHGADDSRKGGPQIIEFDKDGAVVWSWYDPDRAGSVHGVAIVE